MSLATQAVRELSAAQEYFNRSTRNLKEEHSAYARVAGCQATCRPAPLGG